VDASLYSLRSLKDFCAFVYCSWVRASAASAKDWTEAQFNFTRDLSLEVEYAGGVFMWSLSHCCNSALDQEEYSNRLIGGTIEVIFGDNLRGKSDPNQEACTPQNDRATMKNREGRIVNNETNRRG
jgi:hypothetical protein